MLGSCDPLQQVSLLITEDVKDTTINDDRRLSAVSDSFSIVSV